MKSTSRRYQRRSRTSFILSETGTVTEGSVTEAGTEAGTVMGTVSEVTGTVTGTWRGTLMVFWEAMMCCVVYWNEPI